MEPATGLVFFRNRWYDSSTGSFLTPDPIGYGDSSNLYVFAQADPVNGSDPLGLWNYTPSAVGHAIFRGADQLKWQITDIAPSKRESGIGFIDAGNRAVDLAAVTTINTGIDFVAGLVGGFFTIGERSGEAIAEYNSATPWRSSGRVAFSVGLNAIATVGYATGIAGVGNRLINAASEALMPAAMFDMGITAAGQAGILRSLAPAITRQQALVMRNIAASRQARAVSGYSVYARKHLAYTYYQRGGWQSSRIGDHMKGIDFTQEVVEEALPLGTRVAQWQRPGNPIGNYFAPPRQPPLLGGVNPVGRIEKSVHRNAVRQRASFDRSRYR